MDIEDHAKRKNLAVGYFGDHVRNVWLRLIGPVASERDDAESFAVGSFEKARSAPPSAS